MQRRDLAALVLGLALASPALAGNPDRAGSAGATQLLINPWARSAGWGLANTASVRGVEGMFGNIAGLARVKKTEVYFTSTRWLEGSGVRTLEPGSFGHVGAHACEVRFDKVIRIDRGEPWFFEPPPPD